jgi:hypothetical protein
MALPDYKLNQLRAELESLDTDLVRVDNTWLKPSQCYHVGTDPGHILFNTNCPDQLKEKVQSILLKYFPGDESRSQEE